MSGNLGNRTAPHRGPCRRELFVNGPVAAGGVLLGRTGGQDASPDGGTQSLGAEVFTLRPDAYTWLTNFMNGASSRYVTT